MLFRITIILAIAPLAGCNSHKAAFSSKADVAAQKDQAASVAALPTGERNAVFFRAVRDAGLPCQDIVKAEAVEGEGKAKVWRVKCEDHGVHLVSVPPTGPVLVTSRTGPQ